MTGRLPVGSVKHATHLFLVWLRVGFAVASRAGGMRALQARHQDCYVLGTAASGLLLMAGSSKTLPSMNR
jgi:hypothetical protein